jgi:pimeloyl-ACP methyl ester carboxylesterase
LLYVDARGAGFSHELLRTEPLEEPDVSPPDLSTCRGADTELFASAVCAGGDALDFIEVVLEFLDTHRPLSNNPVVLLGESYGGNRAISLLSMLQHYEGTAEDSSLPDYACAFPWLRERVENHIDLAFPERATGTGPEQVIAQFGWQVLIQPGLVLESELAEMSQDPDLGPYLNQVGHRAGHDVRWTSKDEARLDPQPSVVNSNPESLALLMGLDPEDVVHLSPQNGRGDAFRSFGGEEPLSLVASEAALRESLGELTEDDAYWLPTGYQLQCEWQVDHSVFYEMVGRTHTFITNARYDAVVWTDALRAKIEVDRGAEYDATLPEGASRPGIIRFAGDDGSPVEIRFPDYDAGHVVTMSAPREFGEDVEAWLHATGAIGE